MALAGDLPHGEPVGPGTVGWQRRLYQGRVYSAVAIMAIVFHSKPDLQSHLRLI